MRTEPQTGIYGKDIPVTKATFDPLDGLPSDMVDILNDLSVELPGDRDAFLKAMQFWKARAEQAETELRSLREAARAVVDTFRKGNEGAPAWGYISVEEVAMLAARLPDPSPADPKGQS